MTERKCSALAGKRRKKKESRTKKAFNKVLGDVMMVQNRLERIEEKIKDKDFPRNKGTGLLVDMLVQVKKSSDDIKKKALDKSFVFGNIELIHNSTLKKMFEKNPELESMVIKRRIKSGDTRPKKPGTQRPKKNTGRRTRSPRKAT